jgi:DNA-binding MarR family transcriptional regulator
MEMQRSVINLMSKIRSRAFLHLEKELAHLEIMDLSPAHGDVLFVVSKFEPIDMRELARLTGRDKSTLTQLVHQLKKNGYLTREVPAADRRKAEIRLTKKAKSVAPILLKIGFALEKKMLTGMSATASKSFIQTMQKIYQNLES